MSGTDKHDGGCEYLLRGAGGGPDRRCGGVVLRNGLCLAHCHDRTTEEDELFGEHIVGKLEAKDCDFRGYVFQEGFGFRKDIEGFYSYHFPRGDDVLFIDATFKRDAMFYGAAVGGNAWFSRAEIGGRASFDESKIGGIAAFDRAKIDGSARFDRAEIKDIAWFCGAEIGGNASFVGAKIGGHAWFSRATIGGIASFGRAKIGGFAWFHGTAIGRCLSLGGTRIGPGKGETAYRLAKQTHQRAGDYMTAGDYFFEERCHAWAWKLLRQPGLWRRASAAINPFTWLEYLVGRLFFGYGEKPVRLVFWTIAIIVACALAYLDLGGVCLSDGKPLHSIGDAVYFSAVTFTTLGFGDLQPTTGPTRLLAAAEAFTGALTMALFAVTLAKRYGRG